MISSGITHYPVGLTAPPRNLSSLKLTPVRQVELLDGAWESKSVGAALRHTRDMRELALGQVRFCRYRFCELKYRGAVGRRQVHCTLIVKIIRFYC
jgi:hypothetical protein